jgi:predicted nuclease with TOPRIM domain
MDAKHKMSVEVLNLICSLSDFEKSTNEKIGELQRLQNNLIKNQHEMARTVVTIDKQQQRLVHQMNFLNRMTEKLSKNSDQCKEMQTRINEKLNTVSCIENMITDDFVYVRNEIQVGNKAVIEGLVQTKEVLAGTEKHFYTFSSNMSLLQNMLLG